MSQLRGADQAPRSPFPLLPLRTGVLFPGTTIALPIGRDRSMALVQSLAVGAVIGVVTQRDKAVDDPRTDDLHPIGTFARVQDIRRVNERTFRIVLEGLGLGVAFSAGDGALSALVLQEGIDYLYRLDLYTGLAEEIEVSAPPVEIGEMPDGQFYVTHDRALGLVSFLDPDSGRIVEVAGFAALGIVDPVELLQEVKR